MSEEKKPVASPKVTALDANEIRHSDVDINQTIGKITVINYNYYTERAPVPPTEVTPREEASPDLPSPYMGLYHFGPDDADLFFGRESFIQDLVELAQKQNFIAVLGASGSGKSSVVLAGLVPRLAKAGDWRFTHFRPGDDPFYNLATALVPLYAPYLDETERLFQARKLADALGNGFQLSDVIKTIQSHYSQDRILLIADQFEELFTLCPDEMSRRQFLDSLIQGIQSSVPKIPHQRNISFPLVLVLTMRADFLGQALDYLPLAKILDNDLKLKPMDRSELTEAIVKPAEKRGVAFEPHLVERMLNDVEKQPGGLPLLEFMLDLLWKKRKGNLLQHSAYEAIGQVAGAVANYAEEIFMALEEAEQQQVRRIFLKLVQLGEGTEDTRRLALKLEVGEEYWPLVIYLANARLLVTNQNAAGEETVEVVHEALIRNWERLHGWIEEDRAFLTWQKRLRFSLDQWLTSERDDGALLRGALLAEAENWLNNRGGDLGLAEQNFIYTSVTLREQEQKKKKESKYSRLIAGIFSGGVGQDLRRFDLQGANLGYANLREADLRGTNLIGANLREADLRGAILVRANLREAGLIEANMRRAYLRGADLSEATLIGANLSEANLIGVNLSKANLGYANLVGANLGYANLIGASLIGVNLSGTNLIGVKLGSAIYDKDTKWPDGLSPGLAGAVKVQDMYNYSDSFQEMGKREDNIVQRWFNRISWRRLIKRNG